MKPETRGWLNKNFIIRVSIREEETYLSASLIGAGSIPKFLDNQDLVNKMLDKVERSPDQKIVVKHRKGVKFEFQSR